MTHCRTKIFRTMLALEKARNKLNVLSPVGKSGEAAVVSGALGIDHVEFDV